MYIDMFNFWYFFFIIIQIGAIVGLYFALRKAKPFTQDVVLLSLLLLGIAFHFLKLYVAPYGEMIDGKWVINNTGLRDSWFINICGANIAIFPLIYFSKNKYVKDYMVYIGLISGFIVLFYPQEPLAKGMERQIEEIWDVLRFYYHHWMILAVPLLIVLLKKHRLSYKRIWVAPTGLLILMLFIILNQVLQSELGFIPLRDADSLMNSYKNASYIWSPLDHKGNMEDIGAIFDIFCPKWFKTLPIACDGYGYNVGDQKYWPWFWMIIPAFVLVTPVAFLVSMIFDHKKFIQDMKWLVNHIKEGDIKDDFKKLWDKIKAVVNAPNPYFGEHLNQTIETNEDSKST